MRGRERDSRASTGIPCAGKIAQQSHRRVKERESEVRESCRSSNQVSARKRETQGVREGEDRRREKGLKSRRKVSLHVCVREEASVGSTRCKAGPAVSLHVSVCDANTENRKELLIE